MGSPAHSSEQLLSLQYLYESSVFVYGWRSLLAVSVYGYLLCVCFWNIGTFVCGLVWQQCTWWWCHVCVFVCCVCACVCVCVCVCVLCVCIVCVWCVCVCVLFVVCVYAYIVCDSSLPCCCVHAVPTFFRMKRMLLDWAALGLQWHSPLLKGVTHELFTSLAQRNMWPLWVSRMFSHHGGHVCIGVVHCVVVWCEAMQQFTTSTTSGEDNIFLPHK